MKKEITALCVAMAALAVASGCSTTDCDGIGCSGDNASRSETGYSVQSSALFGENGGLPYAKEPVALTSENTKVGRKKDFQFGRAIAVGDIDNDGSLDIVTSQGKFDAHSQVMVKYGSKDDPYSYYFNNSDTSSEVDDYGAALAVGKFCPSLTKGDIIVASAPSRTNARGAFGLIYSKNGTVETQRILTNANPKNEYPGRALAVGDINGDGKADLVFQSTPRSTDGTAVLEPTVNVILDMCNVNGNYKVAASVKAQSNEQNFGSAIYIKDMDNSGVPEIIVVDNAYKHPEYPAIGPVGAIFFYKFENGKLVQSRDMLLGDAGEKDGAQISSVAFSDIDGDGDLDLIVGQPKYNAKGKHEGRVRTYTNAGAGKAFDPNTISWSFAPDQADARFGISLKVADLNYDGVDDLIVGAPGGNQGYIHVFMGTKDGSLFSVKHDENGDHAFWEYKSTLAGAQYDAFGLSFETANLDKKGWFDLIVGAPQDSGAEPGLKYGRIDIFTESDGFCYTASRCLVNGKCYEPSAVSDDSMCLICDPKQDNFGFSELVCENKEDECQQGGACDPKMGCVLMNKPDGTACGKNACTKSNALVTRSCLDGVCKADPAVSCGNYVCDASLASCPTSCATDKDCMNSKCRNNVCTTNGAPEINLQSEFSVVRGRAVKLSAKAVDPDGDPMTYSWSAEPMTGLKFSNENTLTPTVSVASTVKGGTEYVVTLTVTDKNIAPETSTAKTWLVVLGGQIEIVSPANNSVLTTSEITFAGTTNLSGTITVSDRKVGAICEAQIKNNKWSCSKALTAGTYEIVASWNSDASEVSDTLHLTVKDPAPDNKPPVINLIGEISGIPGEVLTLDASKTTDPDGDKIQFEWLGDFVSMLSSTSDSKVTFTIPADAVAGTVYTVALRVTDAKGDSSLALVNIIVAPHTYSVAIDYPVDGAVVQGKVPVAGTTDWTQNVSVVDDKNNILCTAQPKDGLWSCIPDLVEGDYTIRAYLDGSNPEVYSEPVSFSYSTASVNAPPIVVLQDKYEGIPGEHIILDASKSSDPEKTKLTFRWTGDAADLLSDTSAAAPEFMIPHEAKEGTVYAFTLKVTDADGLFTYGKTKVTVLKGEEPPYFVNISSPKTGDSVAQTFTISGNATADSQIVVRDDADKNLCEADSDARGAWACEATLDAGEHTFYAHLMGAELPIVRSDGVTVTVEADVLPVPTITDPANGSVIAIRPSVEGKVSAKEGVVSVWTVDSSLSTLLCLADVTKDGTWKCTSGYNLKYDTEYSFRASYQASKEASEMGGMSKPVVVRTQPQEVADIKITSPANGSRLPSHLPVIFGGEAEPTTIVDVYLSRDDKEWSLACTATAGASGYWSCEDIMFESGTYIAYADDSRDKKIIPSARVAFEVYYSEPYDPDDEVVAYGVKGGSCSAAPVSGGAFGWVFLLAGFVGAGVIRRRRMS